MSQATNTRASICEEANKESIGLGTQATSTAACVLDTVDFLFFVSLVLALVFISCENSRLLVAGVVCQHRECTPDVVLSGSVVDGNLLNITDAWKLNPVNLLFPSLLMLALVLVACKMLRLLVGFVDMFTSEMHPKSVCVFFEIANHKNKNEDIFLRILLTRHSSSAC